MLHQFDRPSRTFVRILMIVLSVSVSRLAIGQTCTQPNVPSFLTNISSALEDCPEVDKLYTTGDPALAERAALRTKAEGVLKKSGPLDAAEKIADLAETQSAQKRADNIKLLQISALVIGGIGAGVGGGLHLVNNPQVGHAATVLALTAGVTGAGINLLVLHKNTCKQDVAALPPVVQRYIRSVKDDQKFQIETLCKNPSQLSELVLQMREEALFLAK